METSKSTILQVTRRSASLPTKRFLTDFQLIQDVWKKLSKGVISHTTLYHIRVLMRTVHYLYPGFVNLTESLRFL